MGRPSLGTQRRRHALVAIIAVMGALALAACSGPAQLHGVMIEPPRVVDTVTFTTSSGAAYSTAPETGRPMVLFFGYTHCPDICPTTLADWTRAKRKLGKRGDAVRWVFVTVDPERDTPAVAEKYAHQFDPAFVGLSGNAATTARMLKAFDVSAARESITDSTHYLVSHAAQAFLIDTKGRLVAIYPPGIGWDALAADLETFL